MKKLNLVYPENSDIEYRIDKFPDGQQQVVIDTPITCSEEFYTYKEPLSKEQIKNLNVQIKARLNNFKDLELIICATKSLKNLGVKKIHLYTPYFLGSRSDRQFEEGSNNYLKDVICPVINSLNFESITVMDPHSDVLEACLNNFKKVDNKRIMQFFLQQRLEKGNNDTFTLISPDAGANKKIYKLAESMGYKGDIITCSKDRDIDGKLTKTIVPYKQMQDNWFKDRIIIDDICDGGNTFINIIKEINFQQADRPKGGKNYLVVTHGIFSKGYTELSQYFDGIYCTNSYKDINETEYHALENIKTNVKQLNIF